MRQSLPGALREITRRQGPQEHPDLGERRRVRIRHPQPVPDRHSGRAGHHERRRHLPQPAHSYTPALPKIPVQGSQRAASAKVTHSTHELAFPPERGSTPRRQTLLARR